MIITSSIERKIMSEIDEMGKYLRNQFTNLGGVDGVNGGGGGYPRGKLPQTKVTFDTTESTDGTIPASGLSLVINLNRIRSGDALGDHVILPRHLASGIGIVKVTVGEMDGTPLISDVDKIVFTDGTVTDLGNHTVQVDFNRINSVVSYSGGVNYQWYADGPIAVSSGIDGIYKLTGQFQPNNVTMHLKNSGPTITSADIQKSSDGVNWTSIFSGAIPSLSSGQVYSNFQILGVVVPKDDLIRSIISQAADYAKDLTISLEGQKNDSSLLSPTITLTGDIIGTGTGTIPTAISSGIITTYMFQDNGFDLTGSTKLAGILSPINGGTGQSNSGSIIITDDTSIQGGGTLDLAGFTATVPRTGNVVVGNLQALLTVEGVLSIGTNPLRIYNKTGIDRTITEVFISANSAPYGDSIIVDVNMDGTTIFTNQANRPAITNSNNTGGTTSIDISTWTIDSYLQIEVDQVGSSTPGSNLTVHIIYN